MAFIVNASFTFQETIAIPIDWKDKVNGDFSFIKHWRYADNVFTNKYGELVCDGFCDDTLRNMTDKNGRIKKDFRKAYYQILDTTHYFYSLKCEAWSYEYGEANFMEAYKHGKDSVVCHSITNVATHSSLNLIIVKDKCYPVIKLNSIRRINGKNQYTFHCTDGMIQIDKNMWKKGIMKASFLFHFYNHLNPQHHEPMYWKGCIYTKIKNENDPEIGYKKI